MVLLKEVWQERFEDGRARATLVNGDFSFPLLRKPNGLFTTHCSRLLHPWDEKTSYIAYSQKTDNLDCGRLKGMEHERRQWKDKKVGWWLVVAGKVAREGC